MKKGQKGLRTKKNRETICLINATDLVLAVATKKKSERCFRSISKTQSDIYDGAYLRK